MDLVQWYDDLTARLDERRKEEQAFLAHLAAERGITVDELDAELCAPDPVDD